MPGIFRPLFIGGVYFHIVADMAITQNRLILETSNVFNKQGYQGCLMTSSQSLYILQISLKIHSSAVIGCKSWEKFTKNMRKSIFSANLIC